jgi:hypothetical protein
MRKGVVAGATVGAVTGALVLSGSALAHEERESTWPTYPASVPQLRDNGPTEVVCKSDSAARLERAFGSVARNRLLVVARRHDQLNRRELRLARLDARRHQRRAAIRHRLRATRHRRAAARDRALAARAAPLLADNMTLLRTCRFNDIQAAVNAAGNGTQILVLPGVYKEEPSRAAPIDDPRCASMTTTAADGAAVPSYEYQRNCPNARNLIAIVGDTNGDRRCDSKCDIQIRGTTRPQDVLIQGDRKRLNIIRADRADGIYLANFTIEYSDFNNIYVLETAGFAFHDIVSRYSREYGFLTFTSEAGLYKDLEAYGNGDSGVYPGSGPQGQESERQCQTYGIEITGVDSHDNNLGYSGTSGDSIYTHDNRFHHNATGIATDSFAAGHPGAPQHCAKWQHNYIYSNNLNIFTPERQSYCAKPAEQRDPKVLCSAFQVPVGTGMLIAGGNKDIMRDNWVWDNWRNGFMLFWVPSVLRGEGEVPKQQDTSYDNRYEGNHMGVRPDGTRDPNGKDFWWDEEGTGNCWQGNVGPAGKAPTSDPLLLPDCASGGNKLQAGPQTSSKDASLVPCATWNPNDNQFPPGCDWFTTPPEPQ